MPSFWKFGGMRMSVTRTCGSARVGAGDELVVVLGDADDLEVGLRGEQRPHALAHDQRVVGEEHGDPTASVHAHADWTLNSGAGPQGRAPPHDQVVLAPLPARRAHALSISRPNP